MDWLKYVWKKYGFPRIAMTLGFGWVWLIVIVGFVSDGYPIFASCLVALTVGLVGTAMWIKG